MPPSAPSDEAVLGRLGERHPTRPWAWGEPHHASERRGIGGALHAQVGRPVPRDVDDDRAQRHQRQHRAGEDHHDLAALTARGNGSAASSRPGAGAVGRSGAMLILSQSG